MNVQSNTQDARVRLVPVIEMDPTDYGGIDRPLPVDWTADGYLNYWYACLADAGIEGLKPVGFCCVPMEQFTSVHVLERLIHACRFEDDSDSPENSFDRFLDPEEHLIAFSGGYALSLDDRIVCTPRCCADLANIEEWQMAADYRLTDWKMIWIGHPWIDVRYDGDCLVFIDPTENEGQGEWIGEISIAPDLLQQAIDQAKQSVRDFYRRLLPVVERLVPSGKAVQIARILTAVDRE